MLIAAAVYAGHRFAREFDEPEREGPPFKREWIGPPDRVYPPAS